MTTKEWAVHLGALENVSRCVVQNATIIQRSQEKLERRGRETAMKEALRKVYAASSDNVICIQRLKVIRKELETLAPRVNKQGEVVRLRSAIAALFAQIEDSQKVAARIQEDADGYDLTQGSSFQAHATISVPFSTLPMKGKGDQVISQDERAPLMGRQQTQVSPTRLLRQAKEEEYAFMLMHERTHTLQEIHDSIEDVHEIMKDISSMVQDQGGKVEDISIHVHKTAEHVQEGVSELQKTDQASRKERWRFFVCWLLCLLLLLFIVFTNSYL